MNAAEGLRPLVVVGDTLLDVDVSGTATRLAPDDVGPVLDDLVEVTRPGGAGLTALLAGLDWPVVLVTAIGNDEEGERLRAALTKRVQVLDLHHDGPTVVKTRVRANGRTLVRLDRGSAETRLVLDQGTRDQLRALLEGCAGVLASDYGLGVLGQPHLRRALARAAGDLPIVWDPHPRGSAPVPGVALATPNATEAAQLAGHAERCGDLGAAIQQARTLAARWRVDGVAVTRGADGAVLASGTVGAPLVVVPPVRAAGDTCGAGDAFAAAAAIALASGQGVDEAVRAGVHGASGFVARGAASGIDLTGEAQASHDTEVSRGSGWPAAGTEPGIGPDAVEAAVARTRATGGCVVMAGGCFDLLHAGHVTYLQAARSLGDCLVVALNSDRSVRALKGPDRPLVGQDDRAKVLAALGCVDAVLVFDEDTPAAVLHRWRPDIFAKGGDYRTSRIPETDVVEGYGGQVVTLPALVGRSSTRLVEAARTSAPAVGQPGPTIQEEASCPTPRPA